MNKINKEIMMNCIKEVGYELSRTALYSMWEGHKIALEAHCKETECAGPSFFMTETECTHIPYMFEDWVFVNMNNSKVKAILRTNENTKLVIDSLDNIKAAQSVINDFAHADDDYQEPIF